MYLLKEDGGYLLKEDGGRIIVGAGSISQPSTAGSFLLKEDGAFLLKEDGGYIVLVDGVVVGDTGLRYLTNEPGSPLNVNPISRLGATTARRR